MFSDEHQLESSWFSLHHPDRCPCHPDSLLSWTGSTARVTDWAGAEALCVSGIEMIGMEDWWLLLIVDLFVSGREDIFYRGLPLLFLTDWLHCTPSWDCQWCLTAADTFSGYGFAGPFQSANSSRTVGAIEINLNKSDNGVPSITEARADRQSI